ncbi:nicalin-1-like protein isoform X2 [Tanacetum coccineum]
MTRWQSRAFSLVELTWQAMDGLDQSGMKGWLPGSKADGDSNHLSQRSIILCGIISDTLGIIQLEVIQWPGVSWQFLAIARYIFLFYIKSLDYFLFYIPTLTSGAPYNYNGTQKWLRSFDQRLRESIDYAICLNSLGSGENGLWLHVSKPPENAYVKQIFEGLSNVAEEVGLTVGLKHKKINVSNSRVAWEHEQFLRLRVTTATLSGLSAPPDLLESTGDLFDNREFVTEATVVKSVKVVAESLAV